jgi:hypothetical protein
VSIHRKFISIQEKNITNYDFKDASGLQVLICKQGVAHSMKPCMSLNNEKNKYAIGLSLNEYNAIGNSANSNSWNTLYLGIQNVVSYSLLGRVLM